MRERIACVITGSANGPQLTGIALVLAGVVVHGVHSARTVAADRRLDAVEMGVMDDYHHIASGGVIHAVRTNPGRHAAQRASATWREYPRGDRLRGAPLTVSMDDVTPMKAFASHLPALFIGALAFLLFTGGSILAPTDVNWLMRGGDSAQHWLGWEFFRQSPLFQWPLGANPNYGMELGSSIVFSDSIPLLALVFKPLSPILPDTFQYFGLWLFACFLLQSYFAWKLLGLLTSNRWLRLLGCAFFLIAPAWLWRLRGHHALFGHWTLLAALLLYFSSEFSARRWTGLLVVTALIHAYLLAMVLAIYLADLGQRGWARQLSAAGAGRSMLVASLSVAAVMWAAGYFMLGADTGPGGFGVYRMDLMSLVDPDDIWSALLPNWDQQPGEYEGFNFLGSGMLGLGLVAVLAAARKKGPDGKAPVLGAQRGKDLAWSNGTVPRIVPILALSLLLSLFAISNHAAVAGRELLSYPLPPWIQPLADTFRSSGRFFWPVYYLIYLAIFHRVFTRFSSRSATAICIIALIVQTVDSNAAREWYGTRLAHKPEWSSPLRSELWDDIAARYRKIIVVLPHNASPDWKPLSRFAADHGMTINTGYFARIDHAREREAGRRVVASIRSNRLDTDSLYIFQDDELWKFSLSQIRPMDVAGTLDGFRLIAPRLKDCTNCDLSAIGAVAAGDEGSYR